MLDWHRAPMSRQKYDQRNADILMAFIVDDSNDRNAMQRYGISKKKQDQHNADLLLASWDDTSFNPLLTNEL